LLRWARCRKRWCSWRLLHLHKESVGFLRKRHTRWIWLMFGLVNVFCFVFHRVLQPVNSRRTTNQSW
jgi:hypothetical protein